MARTAANTQGVIEMFWETFNLMKLYTQQWSEPLETICWPKPQDFQQSCFPSGSLVQNFSVGLLENEDKRKLTLTLSTTNHSI